MKKSARSKRDAFRVIALISAYNEGDVIGRVIEHLVENGVDVYLLDNHSTDDTVAEASRWLDRGLIRVETFPAREDGRYENAAQQYNWTAILRRKEELASELAADWFLHHDADEIRESPWDGLSLKEAICLVDDLEYNCIDFRIFDFPPIDDGFRQGHDLKTYFSRYRAAHGNDQLQLKCWKARRGPVSIVHYGGHDVEFEGKRVFPIQFLLRHYPIRGQAHGLRKVFRERKPRFRADERAKSWHVQYDHIADEAHSFLADPETLRPFDLGQARLELWVQNRVALAEKKTGETAAAELAATVADLRQQLESADRRFALKAKEYENHIGALEGKAGTLEGQLHAQKVEYQARLEQLAERGGLERAVQSLRAELSAAGALRSQTEQALSAARHEAGELHVRCKQLSEDLDAARRVKAEVEARLAALNAGHATLNDELTELRERFVACSTERAEIEARLACTQNELTDVYASKTWRWGSPIARFVSRLGLLRGSRS